MPAGVDGGQTVGTPSAQEPSEGGGLGYHWVGTKSSKERGAQRSKHQPVTT